MMSNSSAMNERDPNQHDAGEISITPLMSLVCFAFGTAQVGPGEELPGRALMHLLGDLDLSASASRSVLLRMRRQGLLHSTRVGREARYRLNPSVEAAQARLGQQLSGTRPAWDGTFKGILYEVPEEYRDFRDLLRRSANLLGYVVLRPGLVIATTDRRRELMTHLPAPPKGAQILWTDLAFSEEDSRRIATGLWDLDAIASYYRAAAATARQHLASVNKERLEGRAAFREFAAVALPLYETAAVDPDLPAELLPDDWPGREVGAAIGEAIRAFWPIMEGYIDEVTGLRRRAGGGQP